MTADLDIYLVGGAVRDRLLGQDPGDRDWVVVGATPEQMLALGYEQIGKDFPVYLHPESKEEYALARTERKSGHGYTGFTCNSDPSVTLEEDLSRRDLTINAIAEDSAGKLIDPYGGQTDIAGGMLRHVSPAFVEDPLRVLRVARFAARFQPLGFKIAPETLALMQTIASSGELEHLPSERVWQELERALLEAAPQVFFSTLLECGALTALVPEWQLTTGHLRYLEAAAAGASSGPVRFATLLGTLPTTAVTAICEQLRAPNLYRELAQLGSTLGAAAVTATTPKALLTLLEQADAWRRPDRFEDFVRCCLLCKGLSPRGARTLRQAQQASHKIDTSEWLAQGIKGPEIGERIQQRRLQILTELTSAANGNNG